MVLQRYRATKELGKGSFGTVYLTEGRRDKRPYVVKVVDNLRENNLKVQEIRVMMHLKHRNIVEMCDFYTSNNQLCIVMEYADGGDLRKEILKARQTKTSISEELITIWFIQVCQALDYAHEEQIIHRDIKPSNIFLQADGKTVKVGDFGISRVLDAASGRDQMAPADAEGRVGTKRYMAPEVLNKQDYSNKADIWSLGCVLFELLTLNHPTYEPDRRIWFEWIPPGYSQNMNQVIRSMFSERAIDRPSPKELLVKLASPFASSASVQLEFASAMQWYDQRLLHQRQQYEAHAALIRQFTKHRTPIAPVSLQSPGPSAPNLKDSGPPRPATAAEENYPGTGLVVGIIGGQVTVTGLVGGGAAEGSRQVEVGDVVSEVDGVELTGGYTDLPMPLLRGAGGAQVRVGLRRGPARGQIRHVTLPMTAAAAGAPRPLDGPHGWQHTNLNGSGKRLTVATERHGEQGAGGGGSLQAALAPPSPSTEDLEHFNIPEYVEDTETASQDDTPPAPDSQHRTPTDAPDAPGPQAAPTAGVDVAAGNAESAPDPPSSMAAPRTDAGSASTAAASPPAPPEAPALDVISPPPAPPSASVVATPHDVPPPVASSPPGAAVPSPDAVGQSAGPERGAQPEEAAQGSTVGSNGTSGPDMTRQADTRPAVQQQQQQQRAAAGYEQRQAEARSYEARSTPRGDPAAVQQQQLHKLEQWEQQRREPHTPRLIQTASQPPPQPSAAYQLAQEYVQQQRQHAPQAGGGVYSDYPRRHAAPPPPPQQQEQQHHLATVQQVYGQPGVSQQLGASLDARSLQYAQQAATGYERLGRAGEQEGLGRSFDARREVALPPSPSRQPPLQPHPHHLRSSFGADPLSSSSFQPQPQPHRAHAHAHAPAPGYQPMQAVQQAPHALSYARHPVNSWQGSGVPEHALRSSTDGRDHTAAPMMAGDAGGGLGRSLDVAGMRRAMAAPPTDMSSGSYVGVGSTAAVRQGPGPAQRFGGTGTETETSRVLEELERVRSGIQETLAKAAAAGKFDHAPGPASLSAAQAQGTWRQPGPGPNPSIQVPASVSEQHHQMAGQAGSGQDDQLAGSRYNFAEL